MTDVGLEKKTAGHELKKHAATIHCSNTLSLLQRKISNALLYHAYKELMLKEEHEISIKQLCRLISYNGNNHAAIKDALKGLLSTVIEWNVVSDTTGVEDWTASSILASVSLQGPTCFFAYSPRMKQLLHSPSMFGKINLFIQSRFKSSYGLALYENCIRYRGLPFTKWFEMETFRKLMGVPEGKYDIFRDFKRRVLDKSIEEVNTYSDLIVEAELGKEGRQVSRIRFSLKERTKKTRLGVSNPGDEIEVTSESSLTSLPSKLIGQFGLTQDQVQQILGEYDEEFIVEKIGIIESSKNYQQGKVLNLAGYFMSALKNNYQAAKTSQEHKDVQQKQERQHQSNIKKLNRQAEHLKEMYLLYREELIDRKVDSLSTSEKKYFMESFFQYAANPIQTILRLQRSKYTQETVINSPQIKALLRQFALEELPSIKRDLITLEKFIENLPEKDRQMWEQAQVQESQNTLLLWTETQEK